MFIWLRPVLAIPQGGQILHSFSHVLSLLSKVGAFSLHLSSFYLPEACWLLNGFQPAPQIQNGLGGSRARMRGICRCLTRFSFLPLQGTTSPGEETQQAIKRLESLPPQEMGLYRESESLLFRHDPIGSGFLQCQGFKTF